MNRAGQQTWIGQITTTNGMANGIRDVLNLAWTTSSPKGFITGDSPQLLLFPCHCRNELSNVKGINQHLTP